MKILIGVDPHKGSVTVAAVDEATGELLEHSGYPQGHSGLRALERWAKHDYPLAKPLMPFVGLRRTSGSKKYSSRASPQSKTARREGLEIVDTTKRTADGWQAFPYRVLRVIEVPG